MARQGTVTRSFTFNGERKYVYGKTAEEAAANRALLMKELEEGRFIIDKKMQVGQWVEIAIETYRQGNTDKWEKSFKSIMNRHVLPEIGKLRLESVLPIHCQKIINDVSCRSQSLIDKVYLCMSFIFETAIDNKLLYENPLKNIKKPKGTKKERRSITEFEREITLRVAEYHRAGPFVLTILFCGARPSEIYKLQGRDIVKKDGVLCLHIRGTKSKAADRYVPLPTYLFERLPKVSAFEYIFTSQTGLPLNESRKRRLWNNFLREMQLAAGCHTYRNTLIPPYPIDPELQPYHYRHTYCTDLQNAGVDIRIAQKLMGHSSIKVTAEIYSHNNSVALNNAEALIENYINSNTLKNSDVVQGVVQIPQTTAK